MKMKKIDSEKIVLFTILAVIATIYVLMFSYSTSPIFPYYYGGDSAQFLTIGKAWYLGKLPYVEVFDHKGPFIFWINMLGFVIGKGQKYGVAFLQVFFMFFSILAFYQIALLFYKDKIYSYIVVAITLFAMKINYCDGNTVEEWCIPFISWSLYGIIRYWKDYTNREHNPKWSFLYGLTFGICFLTRITNFLPLCAGIFYIILYLLYKKQYGNIMKNIFVGLLGTSVLIVPFLAYFYSKDALYECIYGTLLYNFEYAEGRKSWLLVANADKIKQYCFNYFISLSIFVTAFTCLIKKEYGWCLLYATTGILEQFMYLSGDAFTQYPLVCIVQIPILINAVMSLVYINKPTEKLIMLSSVFILLVFLSSNMTQMMKTIELRRAFKERKDRGWEQLLALIPENETNRFVVYGGNQFKELYLLDDLMPCYKYFVIQEWQGNLSTETKIAIHETFATKQAKWILTDEKVDNIEDILSESYMLVDNTEKYYLYKLK